MPSDDSTSNVILENKSFEYLVFSKASCPECIKVRTMLFSQNKLPKIIELNRTNNNLRLSLIKETGKQKPPYVYIRGEYIGGFTELSRHLQSENKPN